MEPSAGAVKLSGFVKVFPDVFNLHLLAGLKLIGIRALEEPGEPAGPSMDLRR